MEFAAFLAKVAQAPPAPVYLVTGAETLLVREAHAAVRRRVLGSADPQHAEFRLRASETEPAALGDELRSRALFAPAKLVVLEFDGRGAGEIAEVVVRWLEAPVAGVALLVLAEALAKNTRLYRAGEEHGLVTKAEAPRGAALVPWLRTRFAARGLSPAEPVLRAVLDRVGADLTALETAAEKLAQVVADVSSGTGATLDLAAVARHLAPGFDAAIWDVTDAVARRDPAGALRELHRLIQAGGGRAAVPYFVLMLAREVRRLWTLKELMARGLAGAELAQAAGVMPWKLTAACQQARQVPYRSLRAQTRLLLAADRQAKTSATEAEAIMTSLLVKLCRA